MQKKNDIAFQTQDFNWHSVFPHMIARGDYSFFATKGGGYSREGDSSFKGGDSFKYCSLEVIPYIFCFIIPLLILKIITSNKLNMEILSVPDLVP